MAKVIGIEHIGDPQFVLRSEDGVKRLFKWFVYDPRLDGYHPTGAVRVSDVEPTQLPEVQNHKLQSLFEEEME